jgi:hypothetical protein
MNKRQDRFFVSGPHGAKEYVHFTAKRVSRTCGGLAGVMLANCVPTL